MGGMERSAEETPSSTGFERVHVEFEWYDGPRGGIADIDGVPHYFWALPGRGGGAEHRVWPLSTDVLAMEREQWAIFIAWHDRFEAGTNPEEDHPVQGGVDARYDALEELLVPHRAVPKNARVMRVEWRGNGAPKRYRLEGPAYEGRWRPLA